MFEFPLREHSGVGPFALCSPCMTTDSVAEIRTLTPEIRQIGASRLLINLANDPDDAATVELLEIGIHGLPACPRALPTRLELDVASDARGAQDQVVSSGVDFSPSDLERLSPPEPALLEALREKHVLDEVLTSARLRRAQRPQQLPEFRWRRHPRTCGRTFSPNSRICSSRSAPHSSSITCEQPAALYSSIAAMQSAGVPAMGRHLSSSASETCALAASRPPCSIASATGRISSCSIPARSRSVSAAPWMFCTLFARYIPAISRAPSRPASRSVSWIEATTVQPTSMSTPTF